MCLVFTFWNVQCLRYADPEQLSRDFLCIFSEAGLFFTKLLRLDIGCLSLMMVTLI